MTNELFEAAIGLSEPWYVSAVRFDAQERQLTIEVDFRIGSRFGHSEAAGEHPVHDTQLKRYRHLNFFQHECYLEVRVPRVKLPDGKVRLVEPAWEGRLKGFTLLFEALVMALCREMSFAAVARIVEETPHRIMALCGRYVDEAVERTDLSGVEQVAVDETSKAKGHQYVSIAADAKERKVVAVTEGKDAEAVDRLAKELAAHGCDLQNIKGVSIDMSPAFIKGVAKHFPQAEVTFDKFHVIAHAGKAVDDTRRQEQRRDPALKGLRWSLLKDRSKLDRAARSELDALIAQATTKRTARAWLYKEQLREILDRKQPNVVRAMLLHWCSCVMRSKVDPMKKVAEMIRRHLDGIVAWSRSRMTNGFLEAINGLFQSAKRKARGYTRFSTIRMVIFLIAGRLDFSTVNPHVQQPT
ncbi:MAG: ISL3 family transposase [Flavobacteriales bacterium]|nr:ISL3 family transposase [Flavobacteriales bacterium]